jgi:hypothetical protein
MYAEYSTKLIQSGSVLEVFTYMENAFIRRHRSERSERGPDRERKEEYNERGGNRARTNLKRLLYSNFVTNNKFFITLTFDDSCVGFDTSDLRGANHYFSVFRKRLARAIPQCRWLVVPEYQHRGAVHYHMVTDAEIKPTEKNNLKRNKLYYNAKINSTTLRDVWGGGFVSLSPITGNILETANYLGKYMSKQPLSNHRRYHTSQNLARPQVLYTNRQHEQLLADYPVLSKPSARQYQSSYRDKAGSTIAYSLYLQ